MYQNHDVVAIDIIPKKIKQLNNKVSPIVDNVFTDLLANKSLNFTGTLDKELAYKDADFIINFTSLYTTLLKNILILFLLKHSFKM